MQASPLSAAQPPLARAQPSRVVIESILAALAQGCDVDSACRQAGISVRTFHRSCGPAVPGGIALARQPSGPSHRAATRRVDREAGPQGLP